MITNWPYQRLGTHAPKYTYHTHASSPQSHFWSLFTSFTRPQALKKGHALCCFPPQGASGCCSLSREYVPLLCPRQAGAGSSSLNVTSSNRPSLVTQTEGD